ncbi:hypothetical protein ABMA28_005936 [Loxostege sticticalis]|uniref:Retinol dehydrogenase 13 n=1 Tax=Loxostege sticticalis TaxID=481309 RepID=A0ABD0SNC5_LOXSC
MCETNARMDGKVVIVTGGSSGVGYEAAKNLAYRGAKVIIASRNEVKLKRSRDEIQQATGNKNISYGILDLASLKSVRSFVSETVNAEERLDVLINNAGAIGLPDRMTEDGLNLTMQVNYFGAFLLTYLLLPLLKKSAPSRVIMGSAASMYFGNIDFDHWNDVGTYSWVESLANSKLADTLFAVELSRRLEGTGVTVNSFDPFVVRDTDILANAPEWIGNISKYFIDVIGQSKEDVGQQIAYLAADPGMEKVSGEHFKFCRLWLNHWLASDTDLAKKLWDASKKLTKITEEEDWESV